MAFSFMRAGSLAAVLTMLAHEPVAGDQAAVGGHVASVKKAGDSLAVVADKEGTRLVIVSGSGIGAASVMLGAQDWGKPLVLEFRYTDGRGFAMLEHLVLATPRLKIQGQLDGSGRLAFYWADAQGRFAGELEHSGYVRVQVERQPTGMRVVLPANMLDRDAKVELEWIDAYR